jgi:LuxR family transcriptional regulator, maltose regulon positive regulatory protein
MIVPLMRARQLHALVRVGDTERAEQVLAGLGEHDRNGGEMRVAAALLRLAQKDPHAAAAALAPVLDGSAPVPPRTWLAEAFMLEAIARNALGDPVAADQAVERALDLAEPDGVLTPFLLHPEPGLLERQARQRTAHAALIAQILDLLAPGGWGAGSPP